MNTPFLNLRASDTPENIYYADLFVINNRNWMILGHGKTDAARIASDKKDECMVATDAVAILRKGNELFGRYDPGALSPNEELHRLLKLDAIAYCLAEEETQKVFAPRGGKHEVVDGGNVLLAPLCVTYPYPAYMAPHFFSETQFQWLANPKRMLDQFLTLTKDAVGTKFLIVPFMPTVEEKAALYCDYVF